MNLSLSTKKELIAFGAGFGVMVVTAIAAYAIPIPFLRDAISDHLFALVVWSGVTVVGGCVKRYVRSKL